MSVRISAVLPVFEAQGRVVWCRKLAGGYEVGIEFDTKDVAFRARMVEQLYRIERYRCEVRERDGRELTSEEAANEWIKKYAHDFPGADS